MPPLRTERAGKACDLCHRQKTRCYQSDTKGTCLRCKTQRLQCSLGSNASSVSDVTSIRYIKDHGLEAIDERLSRLEQSINILVERTADPTNNEPAQSGDNAVTGYVSRQSSTELDLAPVVMIRDAASNMLTKSVALTDYDAEQRISQFATTSKADELLCLFYEHYGRWVRFEEGQPTPETIARLKSSRLLLCSILLIVIRHSSENVISNLSSALLAETKRLLGQSLLSVVDSLDTFRALLILSLWSTSVGGEPLGIDGWLLTSYAINHARVSPTFERVFQRSARPLRSDQVDAWCIWNHLCDAHLQYCVGTRRISVLTGDAVEICQKLMKRIDTASIGNFESRMIAEVKLYFIIHQQCMGHVDRQVTEQQLTTWKATFSDLFDEPRAQFLQMGYYFALLLTLTRSIRTRREGIRSNLDDLVRLITSNLHLATETVDERAQYLTDHIYHIVGFSALTLCQILTKHEKALESSHNIHSLDSLLYKTVEWLRSIGTTSHITHLLARIIESQYRKARPQQQVSETTFPTPDIADSMFAYPDYLMTDLYHFADQEDDHWQTWPDIT